MIRIGMAVLAASVLSATVTAEQAPTFEIDNAWVRALPPSQPNTAAYLTLTNKGENAITIVSVTSDVANTVEIHTTRDVDGLMRMEQLQGLELAPGEPVELAPGGTHLMLLGLESMPVPGDKVRLCLQADSGDEACTVAEVRKSAAESDSPNHQHHH